MTLNDIGLMAAVFAATYLLAAFFGARAGNMRRDVALMGGSGAVFGVAAAVMLAA
jgi:hypothetical protein